MTSSASSRSMATDETVDAPAMKLMKSFASESQFVPGRRSFFQYRDLGVKEASNGRARAVQSNSIAALLDPTGWHYHLCDFQFLYVMKGYLTIEFDDGTVTTFGPGDSALIPGGVRHNEVYVSEDKELIEFSMPGEIGTVNVERPDGLPETLTPVGSQRQT